MAGSRSHQPAGHRRRAALHRRADGQRALPHELFVDHPREPGSRRRPVRPRLQHARRSTRRRCISARCRAICAASKAVPLDAWKPGDCVIHNHPISAPATRPTSASSCRSSTGRACRLLRQHRAPCRHRRGDARPRHRHPRRLCRRHAAQRAEALQRRRAQRDAVEVHPRQYACARPGDGRPRGADRLGRTRRAARSRN